MYKQQQQYRNLSRCSENTDDKNRIDNDINYYQYPNTDRQLQQLCTKHMQPKIAFQKASAHTTNAADVDRQFLETYTNYINHL
jgi:hypothetical protein